MKPDGAFPVVEMFGPTIQGEGRLAGRPCHFIRFGGCDFKCVWCDSPHAVLAAEVRQAERLTARQIVERLEFTYQPPTSWVVLSGGNPALLPLGRLVFLLHNAGWLVQVETQGTRCPDWLTSADIVMVSPKPPSARQPEVDLARFFSRLGPTDIRSIGLKVVVFTEEDLNYAERVHNTYPAVPFYLSCGTGVAGLDGLGTRDSLDDLASRYRWLAERAARRRSFRDAIVLPQLHAIAWGHEQGH